jgi:hypothetical protein
MKHCFRRLGAVFFLSLSFVFFILESCAPHRPAPPPRAAEIRWEGETSESVLSRLRRDRERVTDLSAYFSLSMHPPPPGQFSNLSGALFLGAGPKGPRSRIKAMGPLGRVIFDMVRAADHMAIYIPSRDTLYQGPVTDMPPGGPPWGEAFSALMADFSAAEPASGSRLVLADDEVIVPLADGELRIDRATGLISRWRSGDREIVYGPYAELPGYPPIPARIRLTALDGSREVVCTLSQIRLGGTLTDAFDLSSYRPRLVTGLKELGR